MKRGKPLKRGKGLERRSELKADVEKVRTFLRKHGGLERGSGGLRRSSPAEGPLTPREWQLAVFKASDGRCLISGARARDADDPRFQAHHPLAKRVLRDRHLDDRVWDPRNGVWVRRDVHDRHESPGVHEKPIPAEALPSSVWEFCAELDALEGTQWATQTVLRAHPPAGSSRAL